MKIIIIILYFFILQSANATNYYVDTTGNDGNIGTSTSVPWKSISRVNTYSRNIGFQPGDSILFKRGQTWIDTLRVHNSGSVGSPIVVGAYGAGVKPLITGFQTVTLTNVGNIWSGIATNSVTKLNTVLVNGKIQAKGRYPNASATNGGYLTYQSSTQTSITSSSLTGTPSYVGKEVVVKVAAWILDVVKVASQSTGTLNFTSSLTYNPSTTGGTGFFFQNDSTFLDVQGEWSFDSVSKKLCVYSTSSPVVQVSSIDTLIYVNGHHYITFDNLSVTGANLAAFQFDSLSNITVQNCSITNSGTIALSAQKCSYLSALNDSIQNSLSGAIYWRRVDPYTPTQDTCNYAIVNGNYIHNTAIYAGMGLSNNSRYMGLHIFGHKVTITNNTIDSTGYNAIMFAGDSSLIKNNFISNFLLVKNDGGGIYTGIGGYLPSNFNDGSVIKKNIVINGIGAPDGNVGSFNFGAGIYLDNFTKNITVDSNSIFNCVYEGIYLNQADSNNITNNNVYGGKGHSFLLSGSNTDLSPLGNNIKNNAYYLSSSSWYLIWRANGSNLGREDSNFYSRPSGENNSFNLNGTTYNLSGWQSATSKDLNSKGTPATAISTATFYYNPTNSDSTIYFTGRKVSLRNVSYTNSITLAPFTSAILFNALTAKQYQYKHYR